MTESSTFAPTVSATPESSLSALAIWTLALAVFAFLTFGFTSVPAVVCGHLSMAASKRSTNDHTGRRVALAGLIAGYFGVALLGIWLLALARLLPWQ